MEAARTIQYSDSIPHISKNRIMCDSTSSLSSVMSLAAPLCDDDVPSSELFMNLKKILNGGTVTSKPNTRSSNKQANSVFTPFLPNDVWSKANQLLDQLEKRIHLQLEGGMESSKTKCTATSATIETKEVGIRTISVSIDPNNPTKIQTPIEHKESSPRIF
ncbi:hypothetical protein AVEN_17526-1 [Araneus ventricosus]|uniref:Uncharacterized protein n=1 Tax=Araneus ventricosus TaxID=182803 RepID=A0A4Y2HF73_ARAVE|nr:hypothetical protein AVEN_17526-1 [Araneus ventricosus]